MIKLLILDIDGTITEKDQSIMPQTLIQLRKLTKSNKHIHVCLASGNVLPVMFGVRTILGIGESLAGENGGILLHNNKITTYFKRDKTAIAYKQIEKDLGAVEFITNRWRETSISFILEGSYDFSEYERKYNVAIQDSGFAKHILNKGQNKGFIAKELMKIHGVSAEETLACGDGDNDVDIFESVGTGATMDNGSSSIKKSAAYVSEKPYGEGLVDILKHFNLLED